MQQLPSQRLRTSAIDTERAREDAGLMAASRVRWIKAIVDELSKVDNCRGPIRNTHASNVADCDDHRRRRVDQAALIGL